MREEIILKVNNLEVRRGAEVIIENLGFEVRRGEILTILGPNGAGKSTLLKAILGIIPYNKGEIWIKRGIKIAYLPERISQSQFQNFPLSIKEFFGFKNKNVREVQNILKMVGLKDIDINKRNPGQLSSGQFQRMLIAWTMIDNPDLILFDEPTIGIDIGGEKTIFSLLYEFWKQRNLTIILVTHDLNIVYGYSTDVLCLHKGILCYGKPQDVLNQESLSKVYGAKIKFYFRKHL